MTAEQYAPAVLQAGRDLGITPKGIVIGFATVYVESDWEEYVNADHQAEADAEGIHYDKIGTDGESDGLFQQQPPWWGTLAQRMDPYLSAVLFFTSLKKQRVGNQDYTTDAVSPGTWAQMVQQSAFPDRYDQRMSDAQALYDQLTAGGNVTTPTTTDPRVAALEAARPDFNEFANWCENNQGRGGTTIDLWLIHTQEGAEGDDNAALDLSNFLISTTGTDNPVSYHYAIRQASDGGVTVVDCVDTDQAAWAVANSNDRSISACFAGMDASMSRDQWLTQSKAIDVAAYLAVQDCLKYGIDPKVIPGPAYPSDPPGISDHRYCTDHLKDGNTHVDVGDNFPWDVFAHSVATYWDIANQAATPSDPGGDPTIPPAQTDLFEASDSVKQDNVLAQTRGRWGLLGKNKTGPNAGKDRTLIEAIGFLVDKAEGTDNSGNGDFSW